MLSSAVIGKGGNNDHEASRSPNAPCRGRAQNKPAAGPDHRQRPISAGEEPAEDAAGLLAQTDQACADLETLIRSINKTNASAPLGTGTVTGALARREILKLRHSVITAAADAAGQGRGWSRQLRTELPFISALPVADLRARADDVARQIRELDTDIQRANWEVELRSE